MSLNTLLTLPVRDALLTIAASGLTAHLIFKRWEPIALPALFVLLVGIPLALSALLLSHYSWFKSIPLSFLTYYTTLVSSILLYRLSPFHPLANVPGPLLSKLSQWHMIIVTQTGKRHVYIQRLHEKYGDIVRIGPNEVSIRDVNSIVPLMGTNGWPKGPNFLGRTMGPQSVMPLVAVRDPVDHSRRRRPWNRAFSTAALKEYEPLVARRVNQLVERLASEKGPADIAKYISFFTYDFMGDMVFGGWYEMLRDGDKDGRWKAMEDAMAKTTIFEHIPWITHYVAKIPKIADQIRKQREFAISKARQRYQQGSKTKDLFYYLNNDDGAEPQSPPQSHVVSDGNLAVVAGSDTTASILSNAFYFLLSHPEAYKKLQEEVDRYYPPGEDATSVLHHPKMTYLEAVINESLRLLPAVPSGSQRAAQPGTGGKAIGPYYLPEGTNARIHFYSVQRDPRNFAPHTESFWPERWLVAEGDLPAPKDFKHNPSAFTPFSFGPYNCVGKNLAMQEMRTVLCALIQQLDFKFAEGYDPSQWDRDLEDMFVVRKGKLPVQVTRRH
ncbi:high nitrogen upregulated cytochrome P450 monooxygenase 2 [Panus rudis PR-1116 ss-1]|nr:high nitrogen upregulated cytochrome P450 monooxygenase 2 [Panus rudis PR-1116 ss-1]